MNILINIIVFIMGFVLGVFTRNILEKIIKTRNIIKMKNDKNTTYWNLLDAVKVVHRGKFITMMHILENKIYLKPII